MHHYIDDYVDPAVIKALRRAEKMKINVCQWYDRKGRLHLFSPKDEKRIYQGRNKCAIKK